MIVPEGTTGLYELHTHLYGSLLPEDLYWLAERKPPRWDIFRNSYRATYGEDPLLADLFSRDTGSTERLLEYYRYTRSEGFAPFQTAFDLVIALSHTDPEELLEISRRVIGRQREVYAEYRMMFSPLLSIPAFVEKCEALAGAFAFFEREFPDRMARFAISISRRTEDAFQQYEALRNLMERSEAAARFLTAVDFCGVEEGNPPREKRDLFSHIRSMNLHDPSRALAILYHVGESYSDLSAESAVRWVVESALYGAHRLGHAVALGVDPLIYRGTVREESVRERLDQIRFEIRNAESLTKAGYFVTERVLEEERQSLLPLDPQEKVRFAYDDGRVERLRSFQNWAMEEVRRIGAVVESCPTSNLRIAGVGSPAHHPLRRFMEAGLPVVLGADDPGILDVNLAAEYDMVSRWDGVGEDRVRTMKAFAHLATSEILSGREKRG